MFLGFSKSFGYFLCYIDRYSLTFLESYYKNSFKGCVCRSVSDAIDEFKKVINLDSNHKEVYFELGKLYSENGMFEEAVPVLRKSVKKDPDNGEAYFMLAKALESSGKANEATEAYLMAKGRMEEANYDILLRVGEDHLNKEEYNEAVKELEKAATFEEATSVVYFLLGKAYRAIGETEKAIEALDKADKMLEVGK